MAPTSSLQEPCQVAPEGDHLRRLQKLEAIGRLAGGVAHDFNNILAVVLACCELLRVQHGHDEESAALLDEIQGAADRGAMLTRQLLSFRRGQPTRQEPLDLNRVVADLGVMLRRLIGEHIQLRTSLAPAPWSVMADPGQLEQVLMNLTLNARDAMPCGGELHIETRNLTVVAGSADAASGIRPGDYVALVVRDTGCGMTPEVMAHLFEPFYSTKGPSKGTGLGLATCYGIIKQHEGHIRVASKVGVGTRFRVFLPRATEAVAEPGRVEPVPSAAGSGGVILLVEDDNSLRYLASRSLRAAGYRVMEASHGGEALSIAEAHPGPIDLLVTDVVMPVLSGPKLAAELQRRRPATRVLYVSGYTDSVLSPLASQEVRDGVLWKPYTPSSLIKAIAQVLPA